MDDLLPPEEAEYATRETLVRSVQEYASAHGYAIVIKRSCNRDKVITFVSQVLAAVLGKYSAAPLIRLYKAKERNGALRGSRAYIHDGTMPNNMARSLRPAGGSPLELDPRHVPVRSHVGAYS